MKVKILIPIYNDWQSLFKILENINSEIANLEHDFSVIIVNDASTENRPEISANVDNFSSVKIINMKDNKGHARCNASGLKYIFEKEEFDYVIPMDGDGEDRPEEIKLLLKKMSENPEKVIVGERIKRSESIFFKFCYFIHKIITLTFTGKSIKFGNYTCVPKLIVEKMINEKATWSSFSGSLTKISVDRIATPSIRGERYFGPTKMSFFKLLIHSLSIISVFKYGVILRSLLFSLIYLFLVYPKITIITIIPIVFIIALIISVLVISKRENISEFDNALLNINNIEEIK